MASGWTARRTRPGPGRNATITPIEETDLTLRVPGRYTPVRIILAMLAAWCVDSTTAIAIIILTNPTSPDNRTIIKMGIGLILIWCVLGGILASAYGSRGRGANRPCQRVE